MFDQEAYLVDVFRSCISLLSRDLGYGEPGFGSSKHVVFILFSSKTT